MTKSNVSSTSRRTSKGFTLLELIVVVITLGVLALIAVPSFTGVISSSTGATASNTASAVARDAKALAAFNTGSNVNVVSNANVDAAIGELALNTADGWTVDTSASDGASLSLSKNGKDCEVAITVTAGVVTAGDAVCANAAGGGGGGGSYAYNITAADLGGYGSCNYMSSSTDATLYCMGGATATGIAAINSLQAGDTFEISWCDSTNPSNDCNNNGAGPTVAEVLTYTVASVSTGGPWGFTTVEAMPPFFGANSRAIVGMQM